MGGTDRTALCIVRTSRAHVVNTFDEEEKQFIVAQITHVMRGNRSVDATRREHGKAPLYDNRVKWLQTLIDKVNSLPSPPQDYCRQCAYVRKYHGDPKRFCSSACAIAAEKETK